MILSVPYALLHMEGVLRLVLRRGDWRDCLDVSDRGFWMSFAAMLWAAPAQLWMLLARPEIERATAEAQDTLFKAPDIESYVATGMAQYVLAWALFPIVMFYLVKFLDAVDQYVPYIIVSNWASLLFVICFLVPHTFLFNVGLIGPGLWWLLAFALFLFQIWLLWFIAREVLEIMGNQAAAVVLADLMLVIWVIPTIVAIF